MYGCVWYTIVNVKCVGVYNTLERRISMFLIDNNSPKPIYQQIVDKTKDLIGRDILKENDRMPSVREMASILKINISTVQKAYQILENEKIIKTMVGKGTFITNNLDNVKPNYDLIDRLLTDLIREARLLGVSKEEIIKKVNEFY